MGSVRDDTLLELPCWMKATSSFARALQIRLAVFSSGESSREDTFCESSKPGRTKLRACSSNFKRFACGEAEMNHIR